MMFTLTINNMSHSSKSLTRLSEPIAHLVFSSPNIGSNLAELVSRVEKRNRDKTMNTEEHRRKSEMVANAEAIIAACP